MPVRTSSGRPGLQVLRLPAAALGLVAVLHSCAAPVYQRSANLYAPAPPAPPPPVLDTVQVHELHGSATVQSGTQRLPLGPEAEVHENQPVQVGARSTLRLALGARALLDLGPNSRMVIHKLPRDGKGEERATWLRLEQGYLRVLWSDERGDTPMEISFGRWAARIGAGEHFFDSRGTSASACSTGGTMSLSGVPEWTPKSLSEPCVTLEPHHAPVEIALREKDWTTLRTKRRLQPTLARAAEQQASRAVAGLDHEGLRSVTWKPATSPGAFSASQLAPAPPPQPPPSAVEDLAYAPPTPAVVDVPPQPVPVLAPEDVPAVESAGLAAAAPQPSAPALKWTEEIATDTSALQPAAPAIGQAATIDPASVPVATSQTDTAVAAYVPPPSERATAPPDIEALPVTPTEGDRAEWIVNVATYAAPELAQQHVQQLTAQNFNATVRHETVRGRSSYRVVIEGLPTEAAAQSAIADLGTRYGVRSAWAMRKH